MCLLCQICHNHMWHKWWTSISIRCHLFYQFDGQSGTWQEVAKYLLFFIIWNILYSFIAVLRDIFNIMSFSCFMYLDVTVSLQSMSLLINGKGRFFIIYARRYNFCCYSYCKAHKISFYANFDHQAILDIQ